MAQATNKRKTRRRALLDDFHVLDAHTGELLGYVKDISSLGMMVVGACPLSVDHVYKLAVTLPEPIVGEQILQLEATCRWHTHDAQNNGHRSGFEFGELTYLGRHIVEQIQTEYEFSVTESRS